MSLASRSFWPKAAISPNNLQVPARTFCMGWVFCTYSQLIYRKLELGSYFRSLSPPCPTELPKGARGARGERNSGIKTLMCGGGGQLG